MNRKIKLILNYFFIFLEGLLLLVFTVFSVLNLTVFRANYVIKRLEKNSYYEQLYDDIKTEMSYYTNQSGFLDDIIDDTFTVDMIKNDVNGFIKCVYDNKEYTVDTNVFQENLNKKIDNYIEKENFTVTNRSDIDKFVSEMAKIYSNKIKLMGYVDHFRGSFNKIISWSIRVNLIVLSLFLILVFLRLFFVRRKTTSILLYMNTFMLLSLIIYIKSRIKISSIFIYGKILSDVLISIINHLFVIMIIISLLYLGLGIVLNLMKKEYKYK